MDSAKQSLISRRSVFSRHFNACDSFLSDVDSLDASDWDISMVERINGLFAKVEDSLNTLEEVLASSSGHLDGESFTKEDSHVTKFSKDVSKLRERILKTSASVRAQARPSRPDSSSSNHQNISKINLALKPEKLSSSCTLAEFRSWNTGFTLFYSSNHMDTFPLAEQRGYLHSCLELKLQQMLSTKTKDDTPILGSQGCISELREIFVQHIPLLTRRYNFFRCDQQPGEKFSDWYLRLQLEGQEAELDTIEEDDLYILRLVTGISDRRLREEFLRQSDPSRDLLHRTAMAWESATTAERSISNDLTPTMIAATSSVEETPESIVQL